MFFTKVGLGVARLAFWLGAANLLIGIALSFSDGGPTTMGGLTPGRLMNSGLYGILVGIGLGVLAEISLSVAGRKEE